MAQQANRYTACRNALAHHDAALQRRLCCIESELEVQGALIQHAQSWIMLVQRDHSVCTQRVSGLVPVAVEVARYTHAFTDRLLRERGVVNDAHELQHCTLCRDAQISRLACARASVEDVLHASNNLACAAVLWHVEKLCAMVHDIHRLIYNNTQRAKNLIGHVQVMARRARAIRTMTRGAIDMLRATHVSIMRAHRFVHPTNSAARIRDDGATKDYAAVVKDFFEAAEGEHE